MVPPPTPENDESTIQAPPRWMSGLLATLIVAGLGHGMLLWRDVSVLSASVDDFKSPGERFTAGDGATLRLEIQHLRDDLNSAREEIRRLRVKYDDLSGAFHVHLADYKDHVGWGKQWTVNALEKMDENKADIKQLQQMRGYNFQNGNRIP